MFTLYNFICPDTSIPSKTFYSALLEPLSMVANFLIFSDHQWIPPPSASLPMCTSFTSMAKPQTAFLCDQILGAEFYWTWSCRFTSLYTYKLWCLISTCSPQLYILYQIIQTFVTLHKSSNDSSYHSPSANYLTLTYQREIKISVIFNWTLLFN